jgi:hypothetical protein
MAEKVEVIFQVLWLIISIPFLIILIVYGAMSVEHGFSVMATAGPAAFIFVILVLFILVTIITILLRFNLLCFSVRGIGLAVVIVSLVIENLALIFYGKYSSDSEAAQARVNIGLYVLHHNDDYTKFWTTFLLENLNDPDAAASYVKNRTITPARLVLGFGLTWFVIHITAFYLLIMPKETPMVEALLKTGSGTYSG